jgi:tetratricopeptide (TPR) repeat protein
MSVLGRLFHRAGMSDYRRGIVSFNNGDLDAAVEAFEQTLETIQDPSDPYYSLGRFYAAEAHCKLGLSLYHRGDIQRAAAELRKALGCGYRYPDLHAHLAAIFDRQGEHAAAERESRAALEIHPAYLDARARLMIALHSQGRAEEAATEFQKLIGAGFPFPKGIDSGQPLPLDESFLPELRELLDHRQKGRWELSRAVESYDRGDSAQAADELRAAIAEQPRYADLRCRLGSLLIESDRVEDGLREMLVALEINPNYVEARLQAGLAYLRLGRPGDAITQLRVAAVHQPGYPDVQLFLGLALLREGSLAEASAVLEASLKSVPGFHRARYALGLVHLAGGQLDRALREFRQAVDGDPLLLRARVDLGFLQVKRGEPEVAATLFRQVLARDPEDAEARLGLGLALAASGQIEPARGALDAALQSNPRSVPALEGLARVEFQAGKLELAGSLLDRALVECGGRADLHSLRGRVWAGLGDHGKAMESHEAALAIYPGFADARVGLALALFGLGRKEEARGEMAAALKTDPTHPIARAFVDDRLVADL